MKALFIESSKLGSIVEGSVRSLSCHSSKRTRASEAKKLDRLLHDLHLMSNEERAVAFGLGVEINGEVGLIVAAETIKIEGSIQP